MADRKFSVVVVDDSSDDRLFVRRLLERSGRFSIVGELSDGQEAVEYLQGDGAFANRKQHPLPDILILDLKMPRKSGFDLLHWLQEKRPPRMLAFVTSGSHLPADIETSQRLGADGYFEKTSDMASQDEMARTIVQRAENHFPSRNCSGTRAA